MFQWWRRKARARIEALKSAAGTLGLQFQAKETFSSVKLLADLWLFQLGHSRRIRNILSREDEAFRQTIQIFDYHFTIQAGNAQVPTAHTVFFINAKNLDLPLFRIQPKSRFRKWMDRMNWSKKTSPVLANNRFNTLYHLKTSEPGRIRMALNEKIVYILNEEKNLCVEGINYFLILYRYNKLQTPDKMEHFFTAGMAIYSALKKD